MLGLVWITDSLWFLNATKCVNHATCNLVVAAQLGGEEWWQSATHGYATSMIIRAMRNHEAADVVDGTQKTSQPK